MPDDRSLYDAYCGVKESNTLLTARLLVLQEAVRKLTLDNQKQATRLIAHEAILNTLNRVNNSAEVRVTPVEKYLAIVPEVIFHVIGRELRDARLGSQSTSSKHKLGTVNTAPQAAA